MGWQEERSRYHRVNGKQVKRKMDMTRALLPIHSDDLEDIVREEEDEDDLFPLSDSHL